MGRTIPSYSLASEREKRKWKIFREELDKSERKTFDEIMSYSFKAINMENYLSRTIT